MGEDDLVPLTVLADGTLEGTLTLSVPAGGSRIRVWENPDRTGAVTPPKQWPLLGLNKTFFVTLYVEGIASSTAARDVELNLAFTGEGGPCEDRVKLTVLDVAMDPITSGSNPVPMNPAIVAPLNPLLLDDFSLWWEANTFGLTTLQPNLDLTVLPVTWVFIKTSGFVNPTAQVVVAQDLRSARFEIPFPSWGNLGEGRMEFRVDEHACATATTLIKNVQPDLEPGDFRFAVKAHLCTDGAGTSTTRTDAEVRTIMADVTKVLSQCGILVTLSQVVVTTVHPAYMKLDSTALLDMWLLFGTNHDDFAIDVFFINAIDFNTGQQCGQTSGLAGTPAMSGPLFTGGIALPDNVCDADSSGQEVVRTLAHELVHYLLNHMDGETDHVYGVPVNLMSPGANQEKRDLTENQCAQLRTNSRVD